MDAPDNLPKEESMLLPVPPWSVRFAERVKVIVTSPSRNLNETFVSCTSIHSISALLGDEDEWDKHAGELNSVGYKNNQDINVEVPSEL